MIRWTLTQIADALGARPQRDCTGITVRGVTTDTRGDIAGSLFFALRGERFDAHDFVHDAIAHSPACIILDRPDAADLCRNSGTPAILVPDTGEALLRLAGAYRASWARTKVIAVTGSNGKTSTVRLIDAALRASLSGHASKKSFNNAVGVPLTILGTSDDAEYLVAEAGMNAPGELLPLTRALAPDFAVITSIGTAHIEAFGAIEGIAKEKASILAGVPAGGQAVVTADAATLAPHVWAHRDRVAVHTFGHAPGAHTRVLAAKTDEHRTTFTLADGSEWQVPLLGAHHASNATAAIVIARALGLSDGHTRAGLAEADPPDMRFQAKKIAGLTVYNDAYNASPESVAAAARTFADISRVNSGGPGRRVVVLGDMLEMGDYEDRAHDRALESCRAIAPDLLALVGQRSHAAAQRARISPGPRLCLHSEDDESLEALCSRLMPGDRVLLKASRGLRLERVTTILARLHSPPA